MGDWLVGTFCGCLVGAGVTVIGDEVSLALGASTGDFVGIDVEGKRVTGSSVGAPLVGAFCGCVVGLVVIGTCGFRVGINVTTALGAATGD